MQKLAVAAAVCALAVGCGAGRALPTLSTGGALEGLRVKTDCSPRAAAFCTALDEDLRALRAELVPSGAQLEISAVKNEPRTGSLYFQVDVRIGGALFEHLDSESVKGCSPDVLSKLLESILPCYARALANDLAQRREVAELTPQGRRAWAEAHAAQSPPEDAPRAGPPPAPPRAALAGRLAVLELRKRTPEVSDANADYFTDLVRQQTRRRAPQLEVLSRENVRTLLQAGGKTLEECEGGCAVETGRLLSADLIVTGEIQKVGTHFKIALRLHETKEGRLLGSAVASGSSLDELDEKTAPAADELFATMR